MNIGALVATFLAAGVEWVEALTIVVAVGVTRTWRAALLGAGLALVVLLCLIGAVTLIGSQVGALVPLPIARTIIGVFLLLFGIRWLHKAVLRSAGLISLHDEERAFLAARERLVHEGAHSRAGIATAFGGTFLEGLEVVFIVVALAGLGGFLPAVAGAAIALLVVAAAGFALKRPLSLVPENTMKYAVGVMLSAFGTFFVGEGLGVVWWHADLSLIPLIAGYLVCSVLIVLILRRPPSVGDLPGLRHARSVLLEIWGLFVGEGPLAPVTVAVLLGVGLLVARLPGVAHWAALILGVGVVMALLLGVGGAFGQARDMAQARARSVEPDSERGAAEEAPEAGITTEAAPH